MVLAFIRTIRLSASSKFASGVNFVGAVTSSLARIQTFLELEESVQSEDTYSRKRTRSKIRSFLDLTDAEMSQYLSAEDLTKITNDIKVGKSVPQYEPALVRHHSLDIPDNPSDDIHVTFENVSCHWGGGNKSVALEKPYLQGGHQRTDVDQRSRGMWEILPAGCYPWRAPSN